jgi:hypothetical protein
MLPNCKKMIERIIISVTVILFELIKKLQFYSSAIGEFFHNVAKNA